MFGNQRIRLAAAGYCHLAVVAEDGAVYTCGSGDYGQLGLGDRLPRRRLMRVPQALFAGSRVVMVSCGFSHTMAVTAAGHAWTCGYNAGGQLGVGDKTNRLGFTQVDAGQLGGARIVMSECAWRQSVVVSAEGRVWTFGWGRNGRLGRSFQAGTDASLTQDGKDGNSPRIQESLAQGDLSALRLHLGSPRLGCRLAPGPNEAFRRPHQDVRL